MECLKWNISKMEKEAAAKEIVLMLKRGEISNKETLERRKRVVAGKYHTMLSNADIFKTLNEKEKEECRQLLQRKRTRSAAGVSVVAVMTSPHPCPHGRCIYCPGGNTTPQSYTGKEPAALRAEQNDYDPFMQTQVRMEQLERIGHPTDKIELIVMGGTFTARVVSYQGWFVKRCFDAMNNYDSTNLKMAIEMNERAKHRCIGITVETRPDFFKEKEVKRSLEYGATRVELGVQTVYDDILKKIEREHTVKDSIEATDFAKEAGFKVCYHLMPGLPFSTIDKDYRCFERIFSDEKFKPDMLKIYPTLVIKGTKLYEMWKNGEYEPFDEEKAIELLSKVKKIVPEWIRIQRIERDIPVKMIDAGIKRSDIRLLIRKKMEEEGGKCRCIRCREVGFKKIERQGKVELKRTDYDASEGREIFLSYEDVDNDAIVGYLRLRIRKKGDPMIRELKVNGPSLQLGKRNEEAWQHRGYGRRLLEESEAITRSLGYDSIWVISGVGVREYYRKFGYYLDGNYMKKRINN